MKVKILIFTGYGLNADKELAWAFEKAGGIPSILHLNDIIKNKAMLNEFSILAFPGGFSFGDHISSGKVYANIIKHNLMDEILDFIEKNKLIIAICNGFQILTKLGILPDLSKRYEQEVSLIENDSNNYENRWVWIRVHSKKSIWLKNLEELYVPVRHGEGKLVFKDKSMLESLLKKDQVALRYFRPGFDAVEYPYNPNGSIDNIAGIINEKGTILGLMPHPEAFIFNENHPQWTDGKNSLSINGLEIFKNGVNYFLKNN